MHYFSKGETDEILSLKHGIIHELLTWIHCTVWLMPARGRKNNARTGIRTTDLVIMRHCYQPLHREA